jgi:hypothetical protein
MGERRRGLDGPACPERMTLDQGYNLRPPRQRMCGRCGRVTARLDHEGLAWCGGEYRRPVLVEDVTS